MMAVCRNLFIQPPSWVFGLSWIKLFFWEQERPRRFRRGFPVRSSICYFNKVIFFVAENPSPCRW